ncbi:MAG: alpha/beta fold hydrolase, partial [Bacteroidetes bacterium]|nr:alpha/beta fold hydrolase [Bacteroidota bacterium]
ANANANANAKSRQTRKTRKTRKRKRKQSHYKPFLYDKDTRVDWLSVDSCTDGTRIEIAVYRKGNPFGYPIIYLHGGPGGNYDGTISPLFDTKKYYFISFDQRGCGNSRPRLMVEKDKNTTQRLIEDMEAIRRTYAGDAEKWLVVGGSWGSSLAMLYAQAHPHRVSGMILRGFTDLSEDEISNAVYTSMFTEETDAFYKMYGMDYKKPDEQTLCKKIYNSLLTHLPSKTAIRYETESEKRRIASNIVGSLSKRDRRLLEMFSNEQVYTIADLQVVKRTIRAFKRKRVQKNRKYTLRTNRTRSRPHKQGGLGLTNSTYPYQRETRLFRNYADALITYHYGAH